MDDDDRKQKVFGPRVFCFGWYDHGRLGTDPSATMLSTSPPSSPGGGGGKGHLVRKKKKTVKAPSYTVNPKPVNALVGSQTQGIVAEVATGERHTLVITTRGQVLAFGDNTKYALGSKQKFQGRTTSRSSTRPNTAASGVVGSRQQFPSLLAAAATIANEGKIIPGTDSGGNPFSKQSNTATLESEKRKWIEQDKAPRIFNTATPVEVDLKRAGCLVPVHVYAGACTSYALDGNGKLYSWGENHHGQCGVGPLDFDGLNDDEIKEQLKSMLVGPKVKKAKRWKAPGSTSSTKKDDDNDDDGDDTFFAKPITKELNDQGEVPRKEDLKKRGSMVSVRDGRASGLRRGGGYNISKNDQKNSKAKENWDKVRQKVVVTEEKEEEEKEDPMKYGTIVTNRLKYKGASKPMKRRAYIQRPILIAALAHKRVKLLSCGHRHCCALMLGGGLLYSWGFNRYGQLGLGGKERTDIDYNDRNVPTVLPTMRKVRCSTVSCGRHFTVALGETDDDRFLGMKLGGKLRRAKQKKKCMFTWGQNDSGQFGSTKSKDPLKGQCWPQACKAECVWSPKTPDKEVIEVYCGGNHLILKCLGEVLAGVGNNRYGQLGLGDLYDRDYPMYIDSIGGVKLVSAGARHTMATTANNVLFVWGFNCVGEMGTGNRSVYLLPEPVKAMRELRPTYLCAADWHSAVVATDMPDETVPMWREPNCHPDMRVSDDPEGHDSLTITHVLNADQLDDPMYVPEFVYCGLANPPVGHKKVSQLYEFRWDVKIDYLASGHQIPCGIGVALQDIDLSFDPGIQEGCFVYLSTGEKYDGDMPEEDPEEYADEWWWDDVIGVEVNRAVGYVRFYKNGVDQGIAFYKDWGEDQKIHLYVCLAGENDRVTIVHDPNSSGAKEKDKLFEGKLFCENLTIADTGSAPIDVFFECMSCQVTVCRACAYQCHNGHSVNLQISFGNMRCICQKSKCDDHECLSLPSIGDGEVRKILITLIFYILLSHRKFFLFSLCFFRYRVDQVVHVAVKKELKEYKSIGQLHHQVNIHLKHYLRVYHQNQKMLVV
jgi:alpha-tubulin suppressor-like RCC1 family protein